METAKGNNTATFSKTALKAGALRLENIRKIFPAHNGEGTVAAVDGVSIDIAPGQMVTLLGPSGCGKTTTLRIIAGFEQPTSGRIWLENKDITSLAANRRDMGMVFQSYALFPHLSVRENVAYGLRVKNIKGAELEERIKQAVALTELTGLENRQPNQLSGGQQQRVAVARALVIEPKVLLFDEPLSNLDAKLREQMRDELRRIQQELGLTGVYVTHDQSEAMTISDLVVVMNQGKIEQAAPPLEIYRRPATRFVARFIGKASFLPGKVREVNPETIEITAQGQTWRVPRAGEVFRTGQEVELVVRPETVEIGPPGTFPLPGRISSVVYLGPASEYEITLSGGEKVQAVVSTLGQVWSPQKDEEVSIGLAEKALSILPAAV